MQRRDAEPSLDEELAIDKTKVLDRISFPLPSVAVYSKCYNWNTAFADVDWSDWEAVVSGFRSRFINWYFEPLVRSGPHDAYPVLCALCALVEAFTHYTSGKSWHDQGDYKRFLRQLDPVFQRDLAAPVTVSHFSNGRWKYRRLKDFADVFYAGVRCSLHHHGDLAAYAGMSGTDELALELVNAGTSTAGRFSIVVFDPWLFRDLLRSWFEGYCQDLQENPLSERAGTFRDAFRRDFDILIPQP